MRSICISATNPCHLYDMALALHQSDELGRYISGYPRWKLRPPDHLPFRGHTTRTLVTYGLRRLPRRWRPADARLFRWQDEGFAQTAAAALARSDGRTIHAMPGQALELFSRARELGLATVLNHASGPVPLQRAAIAAEYRRAGLDPPVSPIDDASYFARETREYALADWHCAASRIVREQLIAVGVPAQQIWVVPYAANEAWFYPPPIQNSLPTDPIVLFAGQINLRKGVRTLFEAWSTVRAEFPRAILQLCGESSADVDRRWPDWRQRPGIVHCGVLSRPALGEIMRAATVLVLPSWEEAFGLVVPQALHCGLPCLVSDRVGAGDLITNDELGAVFPAGDANALAAGLVKALRRGRPNRLESPPRWQDCADQLIALHRTHAL